MGGGEERREENEAVTGKGAVQGVAHVSVASSAPAATICAFGT